MDEIKLYCDFIYASLKLNIGLDVITLQSSISKFPQAIYRIKN